MDEHAQLINISDIVEPKVRLRTKLDKSNLAQMKDVLKSYTARLKDGDTDVEWPFPPVDVRIRGNKFELIDGLHRNVASSEAGLTTITAIVHDDLSDNDAMLLQFRKNFAHGVKFTRNDRDNAIRLLAKWARGGKRGKGLALSNMTGLSAPTVSRILKKSKDPIIPPPAAAKVWNFDAYVERVRKIIKEYFDHEGDVELGFQKVDGSFLKAHATGMRKALEGIKPFLPDPTKTDDDDDNEGSDEPSEE